MTRALHIDGSFLAYSRFVVDPETTTARFLRKVESLCERYSPRLCYVHWDARGGTDWRRDLWPLYKSNRGPKKEGYREALDEIREALAAGGTLQVASVEGEADDTIATLVRSTPGPHLVWTADKDLLQLISRSCGVVRAAAGRGKVDELVTLDTLPNYESQLSGAAVRGLSPQGWADLLTLAGDAVDGVPGVAGIGPGRALRLLQACPNIVDRVIAGDRQGVHAAVAAQDQSLVKFALRCANAREAVGLSRRLIELRTLDNLEVW